MKNRIIVTGGAGLIGSNVIRELNSIGEDDILVVDHLGESEKWKNLSGLRYSDYLEKNDFLQAVLEKEYLKEFTHLVHLGACSSTTEKNATYLIQNNFEYTKILTWKSLESKVRFLYASSAATYGDGKEGYDDKKPIQSLKPLNMYGYSKHMFDLYAEKHGIADKITGVKYFNIFGYGEGHKEDMRSVVLKGYEQILETGKLRLFKSYRPEYKDGEQKRDFLYAKDAAKMTLHLLFENQFGIYNLGRGMAETWNDLAKAIFDALGREMEIEYIDMPETLREKYQYYTKAEMEKFEATQYPKSIMDLSEAVKEYVELLEKDRQ